MKFQKPVFHIPILFLILLSAACSSKQPVTMDNISLITGATPMAAGESQMADLLVKTLEASTGNQDFTTEFLIYALPTETSWETLKSYYGAQLTEEWEIISDLTNETGGVQTAGWLRGQANSEQIFIIAFSQDPFSQQNFLITGLFTE